MDFGMWKTKVWQASTCIKRYLKAFFSSLLRGKLGRNTRYGPQALADASHQMLCTAGQPVLHSPEHGFSPHHPEQEGATGPPPPNRLQQPEESSTPRAACPIHLQSMLRPFGK